MPHRLHYTTCSHVETNPSGVLDRVDILEWCWFYLPGFQRSNSMNVRAIVRSSLPFMDAFYLGPAKFSPRNLKPAAALFKIPTKLLMCHFNGSQYFIRANDRKFFIHRTTFTQESL